MIIIVINSIINITIIISISNINSMIITIISINYYYFVLLLLLRCGAPRFRRRGIETMPTACGKPCEPLPAKEVSYVYIYIYMYTHSIYTYNCTIPYYTKHIMNYNMLYNAVLQVGTCSANCSRTNKAFGYCAWSPWQELSI